MIWSEYVTVNTHDCDKRGCVRPTGIFRIVQEAAYMQLCALGQSEEELRRDKRAYIVSNIGIDVKKPLEMCDKIEVRTWEANSSGAKFMRYYSILRGGEEIVSGSCVCALINIETGRLIRVGESGFAFGLGGESRTPSLDCHGAMNKELEYVKVKDYPVLYSFIDRNDHMNNTCYADMMFSALPDCLDKQLTAISISYLRQAKPGDVLELHLAEANGVYYVKSILPDGVLNATAAITVK